MTVIEGRFEFNLNGKKTIVKAGDPIVILPRRSIHSVRGFKGERGVFREEPNPPGIYKALQVIPILLLPPPTEIT